MRDNWIDSLREMDDDTLDALLDGQGRLPLPRGVNKSRLKRKTLAACGIGREAKEAPWGMRVLATVVCCGLLITAVLTGQGMVRRLGAGAHNPVESSESSAPRDSVDPETDEAPPTLIWPKTPEEVMLSDSDEGVDEFIPLYEKYLRECTEKQNHCSCGKDIAWAAEHCRNVTPRYIAAQSELRIFRFSCAPEAYLLYRGRVLLLHHGFGGSGVTSAALCDYDANGVNDLLFTAEWGSGIGRSELWHLNLETMTLARVPLVFNGTFIGVRKYVRIDPLIAEGELHAVYTERYEWGDEYDEMEHNYEIITGPNGLPMLKNGLEAITCESTPMA